jgi:hypothetical protein
MKSVNLSIFDTASIVSGFGKEQNGQHTRKYLSILIDASDRVDEFSDMVRSLLCPSQVRPAANSRNRVQPDGALHFTQSLANILPQAH